LLKYFGAYFSRFSFLLISNYLYLSKGEIIMHPRKRLMFKNRDKARHEAAIKTEQEVTEAPITEIAEVKVEVTPAITEAATKAVEKPKAAPTPTLKAKTAKTATTKKAATPHKTTKTKTTKKTS